MRIVVDTNVIVSRFLSPTGAPARLLTQWEQEQHLFELLVSEPILQEYHNALTYPHIRSRHQRTQAQIDQYIKTFRSLATIVEVKETPQIITQDPDDNKFLACAVTGRAEVIVSGDSDLLSLKHYQGIHILTPHVFLAFLEQERAA